MELLGKLSSNNTSNIGMIPSASKDICIKISEKCLIFFNNKDRLNGLKGGTKLKKELLFKF